MIIVHCVKESTWNLCKNLNYYGEDYIKECGFIHCSDIDTYKNVAPDFKDINEKLLLLVIDTEKVEGEVKWEDFYECNIKYPHIYGLLNKDAVIDVLPHLWSKDRQWIINDELKKYRT